MREQRLALQELRGLQDEVILPADKCNTTINSNEEIFDHQKRLDVDLHQCKVGGGLDSYPPGRRTESSLRIYSLPKIEVSLRPIVSCIARMHTPTHCPNI